MTSATRAPAGSRYTPGRTTAPAAWTISSCGSVEPVLADVDPGASARSLFVRAMRIGRSHAASTVNTLVLAYVGATLPLMLVFSALELPFGIAVSQEIVAQEIVR